MIRDQGKPPVRHAGDEDDEEEDGCDLDFHDAEPTHDEELPPATGGVEPSPKEGD